MWWWRSASRGALFRARFSADWLGAVCPGHLVSPATLGPLGYPEKAMGHESKIELWSPFDRRSGLLVSELTGFVAIKQWKPLVEKTQNAGPQNPSNRAPGAASQNRSRSFKWAAKQENLRPRERFFS